jgi:hypothetical protein
VILSDVTKLSPSELAAEIRYLVFGTGKTHNQWNRLRELITELEDRGNKSGLSNDGADRIERV